MGLAVWPVVMKTRLLVRLLWSFSLAAFRPAGFAQTAALTPFDLRCDSAENPLGVDSAPPRLSWKLRSEVRGAKQSAWQVLVASTAENLAANRGDVWDSGRVMSDEQLGTRFAGPALRSSERVFWKVRGWDAAGTASTWSSPATWTIGVLTLPEWQAQWIAHPGQLGRSRSQLGFHSEETREANITKWLQLDLGADGAVREVLVVTPLRADIDPLVVEAARTMRFEPARRGDTAGALALYGAVVRGSGDIPGGIAQLRDQLKPYFDLLAARSGSDPAAASTAARPPLP